MTQPGTKGETSHSPRSSWQGRRHERRPARCPDRGPAAARPADRGDRGNLGGGILGRSIVGRTVVGTTLVGRTVLGGAFIRRVVGRGLVGGRGVVTAFR